ncbi:MAG: 50S ribosomal protein L5 [Candidatus Micrarchaeota archaeon]|nr:50S ribosomal protein L5 [Candidatus Micrarchaeota archaeon]
MAENPMRNVKVNKLVINIGTGSDEQMQKNAKRLIELITGRKPTDEISRKRNPAFKVIKGQKIGAYVTLRGEDTKELAKKLFDAVGNRINDRAITDNGLSFGIHEYIDISGVKYDPKVGMLGMNVNLSFMRNGVRVGLRKRKASHVPAKHRVVTRDEIKDYIKKEFNVSVVSQ